VNTQTRDEYGVEACYRFPLFTDLDLTLAYQYVFNPANAVSTDPDTVLLADGSALSLRLRTTF
jgi:hypothetical protein